MTMRSAVAGLLAMSMVSPVLVGKGPSSTGVGAETQGVEIELHRHAPGAFNPALPARRTARVQYRADAQVLLPLLVTSLRIASRTGVGTASAEVRDLDLPSGARVLAYEFYAASIPEKARGLDRLGFFREAVIDADAGTRRTSYFGAMSVSKEQTLDEAKRAIEQNPGLAAYDVIDGLVTREAATSRSFSITLKGRAPSPAAFFERVYGGIDPARSKPKPPLKAPSGQSLDGYSFLAAFQTLLQTAASSPEKVRGLSRTFVFGGEQRTVEIRDVDTDASRGRDWAARGLVTRPEAVRRLECRITAPTWKVDFSTWAELSPAPAGATAPFVVPLRVEYLARAFLRLVFERES
jgi:hypothetical protein